MMHWYPQPFIRAPFGKEKTISEFVARAEWERWMARKLFNSGSPSDIVLAHAHVRAADAFDNAVAMRSFGR